MYVGAHLFEAICRGRKRVELSACSMSKVMSVGYTYVNGGNRSGAAVSFMLTEK